MGEVAEFGAAMKRTHNLLVGAIDSIDRAGIVAAVNHLEVLALSRPPGHESNEIAGLHAANCFSAVAEFEIDHGDHHNAVQLARDADNALSWVRHYREIGNRPFTQGEITAILRNRFVAAKYNTRCHRNMINGIFSYSRIASEYRMLCGLVGKHIEAISIPKYTRLLSSMRLEMIYYLYFYDLNEMEMLGLIKEHREVTGSSITPVPEDHRRFKTGHRAASAKQDEGYWGMELVKLIKHGNGTSAERDYLVMQMVDSIERTTSDYDVPALQRWARTLTAAQARSDLKAV